MLGTIITFLLGFAYSFYFYRATQQKSYELTVGGDNTFYKNKIIYYYIWNSGNNTIYKNDLITDFKNIGIIFENDARVEYVKIVQKTSEYFNVEVFQRTKRIDLTFDFLRPDEGFTLMFKKNKDSTNYIDFEIVQKKNALNLPRVIKARGGESNINLLTDIINFAVLSFAAYNFVFIEGLNISNINGFWEHSNFILNLIIVFLLLYISPILYKRIRAPRPPKELKLYYIERNKGRL